MKSRFNPVLVIVMLAGLIGAVWLNYTRYQIEEQNKTVEMAMEYEGLQHLADWEGLPFDAVLKDFKEAGVTSLIVFDTTLQKLNDKGLVYAVSGRELMQNGTAGGRFAAVPQQALLADAVYITEGSSPVSFKEVEEDLHLRYDDSRIAVVSQSPRIIRVMGDPRIVDEDYYDSKLPLMQSPLGLSTEEMQTVAKAGFNVIVRPQNYLPVTEAQIDSIFERIDKSGANVVSYIGCGKEVVGFPDKLDYMADKLLEHNMVFGMVEHYTQLQFAPMEGLIPLAEKMDYKVARSYIIDKAEQRKLKMPEALRRWALTDEERNIRINYIKPFMLPQEGQDILELNLEYVSSIADDVQGRGFKLGTSDTFTAPDGGTAYFPDKKLLILPAIAVVAACLMYLSVTFGFLPFKMQNIIMASAGVCVGALMLKMQSPLLRQALAFASACVFPVLSMIVIVEWWETVKVRCKCMVQFIMRTTVQLGLAVLMSLCGAAMISALLGDVRFFLEIDIYRGVKLTFIMPVLLMMLWYVKRFDVFGGKTGGGIIDDIRYLLATHIRLEHLFILGVLAFVAYIFVGRSGHTSGVPVWGIELKMRAMLEQLMYARPRTKEFMIGHPAFFVAAYAAYYKAPRLWQMILVAGAVIGQGSLVQTFAHMRTPVIMSYVRALDGYWLGALIGIAAVVVLNLLMPYLQKWQRRYLGNE